MLFDRYDYRDSVVFGHAKDGNIHFMLTDRFETDEQLGRYADFTEDMVELVLGHGGSLKAEHGTGRVMAPYVRRQYGDELYEVMRRDQAAVRPARDAEPGRGADRRPAAAPASTSSWPRPSSRRWTGAWNAGTASRSARAAT